MINIKGLDKAELLVELYNHSHQQGMGMLQPARSLSVEDARKLLEQTQSFDYLYGKVMKVDLSGDEFEEWLYDRDNGQGMAQSVVDGMKKKLEEAPADYIKKDEFLEPIQKNNYIEDKPINNLIDPEPIKNTIDETDIKVDNTIDKSKTRVIDLSDTYIGIYESEKGYRVGLFEKSVRSSGDRTVRQRPSAQYYEDLLSDSQVALWLDEKEQDLKCDFSQPLLNDPEEMKQWNGNRGTVGSYDVEFYGMPPVSGEIDRHISLIQFTSVYPEVQGNVSIEQIIGSLADFCTKFDLNPTAKQQIASGLKEVPQYLITSASKGESLPAFIGKLPTNEIDMSNIPEDINTIKHM